MTDFTKGKWIPKGRQYIIADNGEDAEWKYPSVC